LTRSNVTEAMSTINVTIQRHDNQITGNSVEMTTRVNQSNPNVNTTRSGDGRRNAHEPKLRIEKARPEHRERATQTNDACLNDQSMQNALPQGKVSHVRINAVARFRVNAEPHRMPSQVQRTQ
jgi:hypothetical protein